MREGNVLKISAFDGTSVISREIVRRFMEYHDEVAVLNRVNRDITFYHNGISQVGDLSEQR